MKTPAPDKPRTVSTVTVKLDPEARQNFIQAAEASYAHYKETGLHVTLNEFSAWVDEVQNDPTKPIPACHT